MTFTLPDPVGTLYTLLSDNWNGTNAGGTPTFGKKANAFRQRGTTSGYVHHVLVYKRQTKPEDIGRGSHVDWTDLATIELRCGNGTVFQTSAQEIWQIIGDNRVALSGGYDYLQITNMDDQSYTGNNWHRYLFDVELKKYGISKTGSAVAGAGASVESGGTILDGGDADG